MAGPISTTLEKNRGEVVREIKSHLKTSRDISRYYVGYGQAKEGGMGQNLFASQLVSLAMLMLDSRKQESY